MVLEDEVFDLRMKMIHYRHPMMLAYNQNKLKMPIDLAKKSQLLLLIHYVLLLAVMMMKERLLLDLEVLETKKKHLSFVFCCCFFYILVCICETSGLDRDDLLDGDE